MAPGRESRVILSPRGERSGLGPRRVLRRRGVKAVLFVPIWDHNPVKRISFQYVTVALIVVNVAVFFLVQSGVTGWYAAHVVDGELGLYPSHIMQGGWLRPMAGGGLSSGGMRPPEALTLLTYMFLHGNLLHLGGNMLFLWVFGDNVEDAMGHARFLLFYLLCGVAGGLAHIYAAPNSELPLIGASGAVAGVIAAYLMLHPNVRVWVLAFYRVPLRVSAGLALGVWIGLQFVSVLLSPAGHVAFWAHIGGVAAGAVLILFMRLRDVPLFDHATGLEESQPEEQDWRHRP
jgi:membrane associated rhomboid family serine protease